MLTFLAMPAEVPATAAMDNQVGRGLPGSCIESDVVASFGAGAPYGRGIGVNERMDEEAFITGKFLIVEHLSGSNLVDDQIATTVHATGKGGSMSI